MYHMLPGNTQMKVIRPPSKGFSLTDDSDRDGCEGFADLSHLRRPRDTPKKRPGGGSVAKQNRHPWHRERSMAGQDP